MASEQVRLAGGKRLEVNTYEMARQSRKAETKDSENEVELKTPKFQGARGETRNLAQVITNQSR